MKVKGTIFSIILAVSNVCSAGIMGDLNAMFMSNSTAVGTINTKDRSGVFAGSFEMRTPIKAVTIVSFDPPRLNAGCGGSDLYGGSFTFINGTQIVETFRKVAANAAGLAFKAAIKTISPSLDSLMSEFQTLMQTMNNLAKNSCQLAHLIVDPAEKKIGDALEGEGNVAGTKKLMFSDATAALASFNASASQYLSKQQEVNPKAGNLVAKAIQASGATSILELAGIPNVDSSTDDATDPNSLNNKIMLSFLGYEIDAVNCTSANEAGQPNTTTAVADAVGNINCKGPKTLTLDDMVKGGGAGSLRTTPLTLYKCADPTGTTPISGGFERQICANIVKENFSYPGVQGWVNQNLFGSASAAATTPGSILGLINSGATVNLSTDQIKFIKQSGLPLISLLSKTSNTATRMSIANRLGWYLNDCITAKLGEALYKSANLVNSGGTYRLTDDMKNNIENLRKDYMTKQEACIKDSTVLRIAQEINAAASLNGNIR